VGRVHISNSLIRGFETLLVRRFGGVTRSEVGKYKRVNLSSCARHSICEDSNGKSVNLEITVHIHVGSYNRRDCRKGDGGGRSIQRHQFLNGGSCGARSNNLVDFDNKAGAIIVTPLSYGITGSVVFGWHDLFLSRVRPITRSGGAYR